MPNIIRVRKRTPAATIAFREHLNDFLGGLNAGPSDDLKLRIKGGVASAHIKRTDGSVQSATSILDGRLQQRTNFDPEGMTPKERRRIVRSLRKAGHRQTAIADLLGVSQATVSLDLRRKS